MNNSWKPHRFSKHRIRRPSESNTKQMLDMRREKYFGFDLDDMLVEFNLGENKNTIAATIVNKMSTRSIDDAFDYIERLNSDGTFDAAKTQRLKALLQRYSRWR